MYELPALIPDAQTLLSLEPEELAGKILFALRKGLGIETATTTRLFSRTAG
jgi:hypothetical protein